MYERESKVLAEHAKNRSLVIFVGAGASRDAGLPDWNDLLRPLRDELAIKGAVDPLDITQWYVDSKGRAAALRQIRNLLAGVQKPGKLHLALAEVPSPVIFTTNYDQLMERALESVQGVPPDIIIEDSHVALIDEARRTTLVKLHGCLSLPETIVLARDDYEGYADNHHAMIAYLQSLLATRTFLFVGFSLLDPNFRVIHHTIRRALGSYRREAYLLDAGHKTSYSVHYWGQRGVRTLLFATYEEQHRFLRKIAAASTGAGTALGASRILSRSDPPLLEVGPLMEHLEALGGALQNVIEQARNQGLLPQPDQGAVEAPPAHRIDDGRPARWVRAKARALLDLASSVDQLVPVEDHTMWTALGDMLYVQGDAAGAVRAYHAALRPTESRSRPDDCTMKRMRGNLARALAHEGHHARAEWLLRRCVFLPDRELSDGRIDRDSVFARLDVDHLRRRPTDATEFAHATTVRAEQLRAATHYTRAFEALREARYVLGPVLGFTSNPAHRLSLLPTETGTLPQPRPQPVRSQKSWQRERPFNPGAYAFNTLGKCYRLSCSLALDLGRDDALYFMERAEQSLRNASVLDPLLPYPYAHRLLLRADQRLPSAERTRILDEVRKDLAGLSKTAESERLIKGLRERFPAL